MYAPTSGKVAKGTRFTIATIEGSAELDSKARKMQAAAKMHNITPVMCSGTFQVIFGRFAYGSPQWVQVAEYFINRENDNTNASIDSICQSEPAN